MTTTRANDVAGGPPAGLDPVERVATAIRAHNIGVVVVATKDEARDAVLALIPEGAEVHSGKSRTLEELGLFAELMESGRYDAVRPRVAKLDRQTQGAEIRRHTSSPSYMLGSVNALTEGGALVAASGTGSQLAAYSAGAGHLILVVGSQKIVPDLDAALRRIDEVVFPYEDAQVFERMGVHTILGKILIIYAEWVAQRTTVVLVREPVGV